MITLRIYRGWMYWLINGDKLLIIKDKLHDKQLLKGQRYNAVIVDEVVKFK
jgi:hypothetical protein